MLLSTGNGTTLKPFQKGYDPRRNLTRGSLPKSGSEKEKNRIFKEGLKKLLDQKVPGSDLTYAETMINKLVIKAANGNNRAIELIFERLDGKPASPKQLKRRRVFYEAPEVDNEEINKLTEKLDKELANYDFTKPLPETKKSDYLVLLTEE